MKTSPKFKIGDKVRCIDIPSDDTKGVGWEERKEFIIHRFSPLYNTCYFPEFGSGVYEPYLELVETIITDWRKEFKE